MKGINLEDVLQEIINQAHKYDDRNRLARFIKYYGNDSLTLYRDQNAIPESTT